MNCSCIAKIKAWTLRALCNEVIRCQEEMTKSAHVNIPNIEVGRLANSYKIMCNETISVGNDYIDIPAIDLSSLTRYR